METKHTPGPWAHANRFDVIAKDSIGVNTGLPVVVAKCVPSKDLKNWNERYANARLIAAAPELLDLVQRLLFAAKNADETGHVTDVGFINLDALYTEALAAIAKATK